MKLNSLTSCQLWMRVGACVLAFALTLCFVARPVRAEAAIIEGTSALGIAAAQTYFTSTGIPLTVVQGGASAGTAAISAAANSYVAATGAAASGDALLASVGAGVSISAGTLVLTAAAAALLAGFAVWCYSEFVASLPVGSDAFLVDSTLIGDFVLSSGTWTSTSSSIVSFSAGTLGDGIAYPDSWTSPNGDVTLTWQNSGNANYPYQIIGTANGFQFLNGTFSSSRVTPIYIFYNPVYAASGYAFVVAYQDTRTNPATWIAVRPFTSSELLIAGSVSIYKAGLNRTQTGYIAPPEIDDTKQLEIAGLPDVDIAQLPGAVADATAAGTLTVSPPVSVPLAPPLPDWDPPLGSGDGGIEEPENPGTENPWLPDDLNVPWHYVATTLRNAKEFVTLVVAVISVALPTSLQAVVWAAVVLAVLFGLIRRFLG